jgi:hypothetical protein
VIILFEWITKLQHHHEHARLFLYFPFMDYIMSNSINTLQQDLFWLAKKQYHTYQLTRIEVAKVICTYHNYTDCEVEVKDIVNALINEFVVKDVVLSGRFTLCRFLAYQSRTSHEKMDYHEELCERLFNLIAEKDATNLQGEWRLPFSIPILDPVLQTRIETYSTSL